MPPPDEPAPWQVLSKHVIYSSAWGINVVLWSVRLPDGTVATDHPVLDHLRPAVAVIPVGADGHILMIDRYRVITDQRGWELPGGRSIRANRSTRPPAASFWKRRGTPRRCGRRWAPITRRTARALRCSKWQGARQLTRRSAPTDRNEVMTLRWFDVQEIRQLVRANEIYDGLSLTGLCWAITLGVIGQVG